MNRAEKWVKIPVNAVVGLLTLADLALGVTWHWWAGAFAVALIAATALSPLAIKSSIEPFQGGGPPRQPLPDTVVQIGFLLALCLSFIVAGLKLATTH